ncbi:carbohydrate ABC transporter permease [Acidipropionibacterium jensenii]|uniref:Carbohydrate ABC transporter permease n=2 Tax=Acidipropionibacterium jensenii TaxID=1749 RepID=A0A3Q9UQS4_9ACTN|nr:carbohydrate ABC transporter permease [Acidipropionibacterium jensenii]AZZ38945.1 carbohydrate ABC transporter permease [Acidipropionibacterium jensenii]AZZ42686.1 carbohydrate ABC transporter permease [Acidipropionibacterium jensenii]MDN5977355.1 carbohydrate ABC transporter permease [Acidipropionibacterium jensenii]MDN5995268.1 carbohydrate ABC transporter permease [Acidipropionibacterium jensenii]MDN6020759.1 carbohydrate ABC transporter permease [Acidipropionibacterium jensenii]
MATVSLTGAASATTAPITQKVHHKRTVTPGKVVGWVFMVIILFITLFPFYWILRTALSSNALLATRPGFFGPVGTNMGGFARVFGAQDVATAVSQGGSGASINFWRYLINSLIVATVITLVQTLSCAMASYAFARLRWKGRNLVFSIFLAAMMIPSIFTFLPNFILMKQLHLIDTLLGIMLPTMLISPFAVFFLRQFFMNISREVEEAALIDGASKTVVFWKLILPMASAPMFTLGLLTYITAWNDYFWPLMVSYTDSSRVLNVALGVFRAQSPQSGVDWSGLMAATLVSALPMLILFACFAKRIVNSIGFTGIK